MTFEESLARLEQIVVQLQRDEVTLEQALALFEEGVAKVKVAAGELARAETRVQTLVEGPDGTLDVADLAR